MNTLDDDDDGLFGEITHRIHSSDEDSVEEDFLQNDDSPGVSAMEPILTPMSSLDSKTRLQRSDSDHGTGISQQRRSSLRTTAATKRRGASVAPTKRVSLKNLQFEANLMQASEQALPGSANRSAQAHVQHPVQMQLPNPAASVAANSSAAQAHTRKQITPQQKKRPVAASPNAAKMAASSLAHATVAMATSKRPVIPDLKTHHASNAQQHQPQQQHPHSIEQHKRMQSRPRVMRRYVNDGDDADEEDAVTDENAPSSGRQASQYRELVVIDTTRRPSSAERRRMVATPLLFDSKKRSTSASLELVRRTADSIEALAKEQPTASSGQSAPTMAEVFPGQTDRSGKPIQYQIETDKLLTWDAIEKERSLMQRKLEMLSDVEEDDDGVAFMTEPTEDEKAENQINKLKERLSVLDLYRSILEGALKDWSDYRSLREEYIQQRQQLNDGEQQDAFEAIRFDDEFMRYQQRQTKQISSETLRRILEVEPDNMADQMVNLIRQRQQLPLSQQNKKNSNLLDVQGEKQKLAEELRRWQTRSVSMSPVPHGPGEKPKRVALPQPHAQPHQQKQQQEQSLEDMIARQWEQLKMDRFVHQQPLDVIILSDVLPLEEADGAFFLTAEVSADEEDASEPQEPMPRPISSGRDRMLSSREGFKVVLGDYSSLRTKTDVRTRYAAAGSIQKDVYVHPRDMLMRELPIGDSSNRPFSPRLPGQRVPDNDTLSSIDRGRYGELDDEEEDEDTVLGNHMIMPEEYALPQMDSMPIDLEQMRLGEPEDANVIEDDSVLIEGTPRSARQQGAERQRAQVNALIRDLASQAEQVRSDGNQADMLLQTPSRFRFASEQLDDSQSTATTRDDNNNSQLEHLETKQLVVQLNDLIGVGAYARVYKGFIEGSQEVVAVKKIAVKSGKASKKLVRLEIDILRQLSHPNLVKYRGCKYSSKSKEYNIVLEYIGGGSLEQVLARAGGPGLPENRIAFIVHQVLLGLEYLHSKKIIHRDLKPANVLQTEDGNWLKITDFGISTQLLTLQNDDARNSVAGTPHYLAPEAVYLPYGTKVDIWSLGSTMFELITGLPPFHDQSAVAILYKLATAEAHPSVDDLTCSDVCKDFLRQCWCRDPEVRPSASQLLAHPFLDKRNENT